MILACIPFRLIGDTDTEEAILVFAVPGSWFLLMFFAGYRFYTILIIQFVYHLTTLFQKKINLKQLQSRSTDWTFRHNDFFDDNW